MRLFLRILPILLLCSPLLIIALVAILYFLGATDFLSNAFWAFFGQWDLFEMSSGLIEGFVKNKDIDVTFTLTAYLQLLFSGALDAIYLGCCLFAFKSLFFQVEKISHDGTDYYGFIFTRSKRILEVIAVCIGVAIRPLFGFGSQHFNTILQGSVTIILLIIGLMFYGRAGKKYAGMPSGIYELFLYKLLIPILVGALDAIAIANMLTVLLDGPRMLENGAHFFPLIVWYIINAVLLFIFNLLDR